VPRSYDDRSNERRWSVNTIMKTGLALVAMLLACGPTTFTDNQEAFRDNIGDRLDALQERVFELGAVIEQRSHVEPEFRSFVNEIEADIWKLRSSLREIGALDGALWQKARKRILRKTRELEQRLANVHVGDYP
jgi:hypothetical protein